MADVAEVRSQISEMVKAIRFNGCVPTMRAALCCYKDWLTETQPYGLSVADKQGYADEHRRLDFLLYEVFTEKEDEQAD
jgi:hypothetical protein